jgi:RNA polymerase sigma factor (sigma-70 family)
MNDRPATSASASPNPIDDLLARAGDGCKEAVQELITQWVPRLLKVIRDKLEQTPRLRTIFDSHDFLQEVRVALHLKDLDRSVFESPGRFVNFLVAVARNKVSEYQRKLLQTQKSNLNRERSLTDPAVGAAVTRQAAKLKREESVNVWEQFARYLRSQPPAYRRILVLRVRGWTVEAIAARLDINEKTVRRVIDRARTGFGNAVIRNCA